MPIEWGRCINNLLEKSGNALSSRTVTEEQLASFQGKLPNLLLKFWQDQGWGSYYEGLLWTVNPEDYKDLLTEWVKGTPHEHEADNHVIARTAFGGLYIWNSSKGYYFKLSVLNHWLISGTGLVPADPESLEQDMDIFFSVVSNKKIDQKDEKNKPLFQRTLKKLGPLKPNEMYAFEPAICLGGDMMLKNLKKVDLFVHLSLLAELQPTEVFNYDNYR